MYSQAELIDIFECYIRKNKSVALALRNYRELYPNRRMSSKKIFSRIEVRLRRTGSLNHSKNRQGNVNEERHLDVLLYFQENPENSVRQAEIHLQIPRSTIHDCLKLNRYPPWKMTPVQLLRPEHIACRLEFCGEMLERHLDDNIFKNILWSDESYFSTSGIFNRRNTHSWSPQNPHCFRPIKKQGRETINVWCGILDTQIIGPYFFEGNMNGEKYFQLLENFLIPALDEIPLNTRRRIIFQHDGALYHKNDRVIELLSQHFVEFIGNRGNIPWPACSPDLTPLDFFLWGALKNEVNKLELANVDQIKAKIREHIDYINNSNIVSKVVHKVQVKYTTCVYQNGGTIEHIA